MEVGQDCPADFDVITCKGLNSPFGSWAPCQLHIHMEKVGEGFSRHLLLNIEARKKGKEEDYINMHYFCILHQCLENIGYAMLRAVNPFQDMHAPIF